MIYLTGDTHGDFTRVDRFCKRIKTSKDDILIILGDAGINYFLGKRDRKLKEALSKLPITLFCIHGNHEIRPSNIPSYHQMQWHNGVVYQEKDYPNLLFAKDGEIYDLDGKSTFVCGGAYSVDKYYRLVSGNRWFSDEQPNETIKSYCISQLEKIGWSVDTVLTHTCPYEHMPREAFLPMIDQSTVDNSTEFWLETIYQKLSFNKWYCGHYHINKMALLSKKVQFLFDDIVEL